MCEGCNDFRFAIGLVKEFVGTREQRLLPQPDLDRIHSMSAPDLRQRIKLFDRLKRDHCLVNRRERFFHMRCILHRVTVGSSPQNTVRFSPPSILEKGSLEEKRELMQSFTSRLILINKRVVLE